MPVKKTVALPRPSRCRRIGPTSAFRLLHEAGWCTDMQNAVSCHCRKTPLHVKPPFWNVFYSQPIFHIYSASTYAPLENTLRRQRGVCPVRLSDIMRVPCRIPFAELLEKQHVVSPRHPPQPTFSLSPPSFHQRLAHVRTEQKNPQSRMSADALCCSCSASCC